MKLTDEQKSTIDELRSAIQELYGEADTLWDEILGAKKAGDADYDYQAAYDRIHAAEGEAQMKELIAHVPKKGEHRVGKVTKALKKTLAVTSLSTASDKTRDMLARVDALADINAWRESLKLPPLERLPKGANGDGSECTLAKAYTVDFNSFRNWDEISVGGDSTSLKWTERVPYTEEAYDKLVASQTTGLYDPETTRYNPNPDYDESIYNVQRDDYDPDIMLVTRTWSGSVAGQNTVVSKFDEWLYPDLVVDDELVQAAATWLSRDNNHRVWDYLQEMIDRFGGVDAVNFFQEQVLEYMVDHHGWEGGNDSLKVDLDNSRIIRTRPQYDWPEGSMDSVITSVAYMVGNPDNGPRYASRLDDYAPTPMRHQETHDPDQNPEDPPANAEL